MVRKMDQNLFKTEGTRSYKEDVTYSLLPPPSVLCQGKIEESGYSERKQSEI